MLGPLLKVAAGLLLIPKARTEKIAHPEIQVEIDHYPDGFDGFEFSWAPAPPLPPGCENFKLISGELEHAKVFLLGEDHVLCNKTRVDCSKGLLGMRMPGGINPTRTVLLFENYARNKNFSCSEMGPSYAELSNDCRGWNLPRGQRKHESWSAKAEVLRTIVNNFSKEFPRLSHFPASTQKLIAAKHVQNWIDDVAEAIDQLKTMMQALHDEYGENYPLTEMKQIKINLKLDRFRKKHLEAIHRSIMADKPLNDIVPRINNRIADYHARVRTFIGDVEKSIGKPNRAMAKAIRDVSRKKIAVVYAGDAHVNPRPYQQEIADAKRQKIIWELYEQLSYTNPYAVLSCQLK